MIIESGVIIFLGFLLLAWKLPKKTVLWALGRPLLIDITGSVLAYVLHWGTFSGLMAAAVAGLMLSTCTSIARWAVGYIEGNVYHPGRLANWAPYLTGEKK